MKPSVVLDTNVLLVSFSRKSRYHPIFQALLQQRYRLCLTTDIALEYIEVLERHMGVTAAQVLAQFLDSNGVQLRWIERYYKWKLIVADPDDNKFVDCALASNADYLVTEDKHFDVLKSLPFPRVHVLGINAFMKVLDERTR